ncbi:hypothetical protein PR048_015560 [Dryococelus australis]|uniref:Uncharacterized protein n=1 Tax=Dryococelus australis TaxID=614101 RepID=A0ABQ9HHA1_9NEOP|nr:hypothetical protein PR048_015560 [Dryococelus australis]
MNDGTRLFRSKLLASNPPPPSLPDDPLAQEQKQPRSRSPPRRQPSSLPQSNPRAGTAVSKPPRRGDLMWDLAGSYDDWLATLKTVLGEEMSVGIVLALLGSASVAENRRWFELEALGCNGMLPRLARLRPVRGTRVWGSKTCAVRLRRLRLSSRCEDKASQTTHPRLGVPNSIPDGVPPPPIPRISASRTRAGQCRWSAGFIGDIPFPPPLRSAAAPYTPRFTLAGFQYVDVKIRPNLLTYSVRCAREFPPGSCCSTAVRHGRLVKIDVKSPDFLPHAASTTDGRYASYEPDVISAAVRTLHSKRQHFRKWAFAILEATFRASCNHLTPRKNVALSVVNWQKKRSLVQQCAVSRRQGCLDCHPYIPSPIILPPDLLLLIVAAVAHSRHNGFSWTIQWLRGRREGACPGGLAANSADEERGSGGSIQHPPVAMVMTPLPGRIRIHTRTTHSPSPANLTTPDRHATLQDASPVRKNDPPPAACDKRTEDLPRRRRKGTNPRPSDYKSTTLPLSCKGSDHLRYHAKLKQREENICVHARLPPRRTGLNPRPGNTPGFSQVGILPDDAAGRRVTRGYPVFPALSFRSCSILTSLHPHRLSRPPC